MGIVTRGFRRRRAAEDRLPPGQYLIGDFPVLSAGPTPRVPLDAWAFTIRNENDDVHEWSWQDLTELPIEELTVDIHCVTGWSKLDTAWRGVSLDILLNAVDTAADYAVVRSYGDYTTNLPLEDLRDGKAWIAIDYNGDPLRPEHGGPARLLESGPSGSAEPDSKELT
jgi:DMSO/TMAO reductase YedYZ molybdopterin-dependent catalytic subunit